LKYLSLTQNHGFLRSGSRIGVRDDGIGTIRDDRMGALKNEIPYRVCQEGEEGNFKPCLIEDEGGPLEAVMQVEASNHRKLLW